MTTLIERLEGARGECGYSDREWSCREGGYLWDTDGDGYDLSDVTHACPACNTRQCLTDAIENAVGWESFNGYYTSGAARFRYAMATCLAANPEAAKAALAEIGPVACDDWRDPGRPHPNDMICVVENALRARTTITPTGKE